MLRDSMTKNPCGCYGVFTPIRSLCSLSDFSLFKQACVHSLCEGIREINKGQILFGAVMAGSFPEGERKALDGGGRTKMRKDRLTSREIELTQLIAEGKANKQIAAELDLGMKAVEKHRERLMAKLNIHDTAGLTRYTINTGIIESSVQVTIVSVGSLWDSLRCPGVTTVSFLRRRLCVRVKADFAKWRIGYNTPYHSRT
jgi:DNA-binding CsgD family transcriptional regulator